MSDLENRIADSLRSGADALHAPPGLTAGALRRAGVIRRRRRVRTAAVSALAVVAAGALALPQFLSHRTQEAAGPPPPSPVPSSTAAPILALLPVAAGVAGAERDPEAVGSDPRLLHFDVDHRELGGTLASWSSAPGVESFVTWNDDVEGAPAGRTEVYLSSNRDQLEKSRMSSSMFEIHPSGTEPVESNRSPATGGDGRTVTMTQVTANRRSGWLLRWEPSSGLYAAAQVWDRTRAQALDVTAALRLDRAQRCVTPLRLANLPRDTRLDSCSVTLRTGKVRWRDAQLTWSDGLTVRAEDKVPVKVIPNTKVAGRDAVWRRDPPEVWILNFDDNFVSLLGVEQKSAEVVAEGLSFDRDLTKPSSWSG